jgi:hypothetical protein
MITTTFGLDKKENLKLIKDFHSKAMLEHGDADSIIIPKMAYRPTGKTDIYISFFHSEISKGQDVFIEFANRDNVPEDINRTLYLWRFNPHYDEEYEKTEPAAVTGHIRFLVPVDELKVIKKYSISEPTVEAPIAPPVKTKKIETKTIETDFDLPDLDSDPPINEMTIRDLAAMLLNKPVSNKEWLNQIIKNK